MDKSLLQWVLVYKTHFWALSLTLFVILMTAIIKQKAKGSEDMTCYLLSSQHGPSFWQLEINHCLRFSKLVFWKNLLVEKFWLHLQDTASFVTFYFQDWGNLGLVTGTSTALCIRTGRLNKSLLCAEEKSEGLRMLQKPPCHHKASQPVDLVPGECSDVIRHTTSCFSSRLHLGSPTGN